MMQPLSEMSPEHLRGIKAVLTDIDDTITTHGKLPALAYEALERLHEAGICVVPVTGRPAGWCDMIARFWPVDGIVGENGAFSFRYLEKEKRMLRIYAQEDATRIANKAKLWEIARRVLKEIPGTAIAADQAYREIDVAIDFAEDVKPLPLDVVQKIVKAFEAEGATAKISSIHVNAWFGKHDKLGMALRFLEEACSIPGGEAKSCVAYCGDSPNDAPMFGYFPLSIGVANVKRFADRMEHLPAYVTAEEGGAGFASFAYRLLEGRRT
jgi:HAD superfamily hydrolase (TIGR01484 family)